MLGEVTISWDYEYEPITEAEKDSVAFDNADHASAASTKAVSQ